MEFKGKVCIVTGGACGIGKALVESLLTRGCKCLFVDIQHKAGESACATWKAKFGVDNVEFMRVDVSSHTNFEQAFEKCFQTFGTLDIVINNAGVDGENNWESQMQTNLFGTILGTQLAIRYMGKNNYGCKMSTQQGGIVLNVSSVQGLMSWPIMPVYAAGKAGIVQYSRSIGHQLEFASHGVKIVCFCPHAVDSGRFDFHPYVGMTETGSKFLDTLDCHDRMLSTEEVAEAGAQVLEQGQSGSVWFLHKHGDQPFEVPKQFSSLEDLLSNEKKITPLNNDDGVLWFI